MRPYMPRHTLLTDSLTDETSLGFAKDLSGQEIKSSVRVKGL